MEASQTLYSSNLVDDVREEVTCPICLELFQDPRILDCGHNFCLGCLIQLERKNKIECPLCKHVHQFQKSKGSTTLPKNRYVANIVEKLNTPTTPPPQYMGYPENLSGYPAPFSPSAPPMDFCPPTQVYGAPQGPGQFQAPSYIPPIPQPPGFVTQNSQDPGISNSPKESRAENGSENRKSGLFGFISSIFTTESKEKPETPSCPPSPPPPTYYAPFLMQPSSVPLLLEKWSSGLWFAPTRFMKSIVISEPKIMYVPIWEFNTHVVTSYTGTYLQHEKRDGVMKDVWYRGSGTHQSDYKNVQVYADVEQTPVMRDLVEELGDFHGNNATSREPFLCNNIHPYRFKEMGHVESFKVFSGIITKKEKEMCEKQMKRENRSNSVRDVFVSTEFSQTSRRLLYFPVFLTTYQHEGKTYQVAINAQTGKVNAQRPYGLGKVGEIGNALGGLVSSLLTNKN